MKLITFLPFVAIASAFVILEDVLPDQIVAKAKEQSQAWLDKLPTDEIVSLVKESYETGVAFSENAIDNAMIASIHAEKVLASYVCPHSMTAVDVQSWLDSENDALGEIDFSEKPKHPHKPPHKRPHRPHGNPNMTVYELISKSKYTTKLAKLINEYEDLVTLLNGTAANFTVFAPTDKAFEKIPDHGKKPTAEMIKRVLMYHVSPEWYPAGRVLASHTIPTALKLKSLGDEPQRLRISVGLFGLSINFYSKVIAVNIFGSNGVIHAVDSILLPPPPALKIISMLPGEFSTLQLALTKTGLGEALQKEPIFGGTFFAPTNLAFRKLGPRINAFLFSPMGTKYLTALLKYHIVANQTLYSDAYYGAKAGDIEEENFPKGVFHVDLPTMLGGKSLSIDVGRYGRLINIRINGYTDVAVMDGITRNGVIHIPRNILIPPKMPGAVQYMGEELSVEDLKERLEEYTKGVEEL